MVQYCRDFLKGKCNYTECKFEHNKDICVHYYIYKSCKYGDSCKKEHPDPKEKYNNKKGKRVKNTECFIPLDETKDPIDMRIVTGKNGDVFGKKISSRDVILVDNIFQEFDKWYIHDRIIEDLNKYQTDNPEKELYKKWHGNDKIDGCHYIVDDRINWKEHNVYFNMVVDRLKKYFNMRVEATRLNWYMDSNEWKPFHHDSAYINPSKAEKQNFTVAISFGSSREAAFEHSKTRTRIKLPIESGSVYCFSNETNIIWRHGILQNKEPCERDGSRLSIILWGFVGMESL